MAIAFDVTEFFSSLNSAIISGDQNTTHPIQVLPGSSDENLSMRLN